MRPPGPASATLPRMPRRPRLPSLRRRKTPVEAEPLARPLAAEPAAEATPSQPVTPPPPPTPAPQSETAQQPAVPALAADGAGEPEVKRRRVPRPTPPSLWPDWSRRLLAVLAVLAVGAIGFGVGYVVFDDEDDVVTGGPAPSIVVESAPQPEAAEEIGFPEFATRNTTRVGGADAVAERRRNRPRLLPVAGWSRRPGRRRDRAGGLVAAGAGGDPAGGRSGRGAGPAVRPRGGP